MLITVQDHLRKKSFASEVTDEVDIHFRVFGEDIVSRLEVSKTFDYGYIKTYRKKRNGNAIELTPLAASLRFFREGVWSGPEDTILDEYILLIVEELFESKDESDKFFLLKQ